MPSPLSRRWFLTTLLVIMASAVCIRLGIWQLDRLSQRREFNAHYLKMAAATPIEINAEMQTAALTEMEYRHVRVSGTYDFSNQVALRNQYWTGPDGVDYYGYHLLTPLRLAQGGPAILIDRGWIPSDGNDAPSAWRTYDEPAGSTLQGIIRIGQSKPSLGGVPDPQTTERLDFWNIANLDRIQQQVPYLLLPVYVQLDPDPRRTLPPYPYQPEIEISEGPHLGYAGQWFTFATILLVGYPFYLRRQHLVAK